MTHNNIIVDTDSRFLIDPTSRDITQDGNAKIAIIQYDHNSERFSFSIPRYVDGHDMGASDRIEIHYININGKTKDESRGCYVVNDLESTETNAEFSWLISRTATQHSGTLNFLVRFICFKDGTNEIVYTWNSSYYSNIPVGVGCNCTEELTEEYFDLLESWKIALEAKFQNDYVTKNDLNTINEEIRHMKVSHIDNSDIHMRFKHIDNPMFECFIDAPSELDKIRNVGVYTITNDNSNAYLIVTMRGNHTDAPNRTQFLIDADGSLYIRNEIVNADNTVSWGEFKSLTSLSGGNITVDSVLDENSENPVQNKVINYAIAYINAYINAIIYGYGPGNEDYDIPAISVYMAEHDAMSNVIHETYATKEEVGKKVSSSDYATNDIAGVVKAYDGDHGSYGVKINSNGKLQLDCAYGSEIRAKVSQNSPITPAYADVVVHSATHQTMSDDYDVSSLVLCATESGKQGGYPVSYDAVKGYINSQVGDISTALDAIIAIDNKLLGVSE